LSTVLAMALIALSSLAPVLAQEATPVASPVASPMASPAAEEGAAHHGIDVTYLDRSTDPGEDFYRFATGGWQDRTEIPADEGSYGSFDVVNDKVVDQTVGLLKGLSNSSAVPVGSDEWKAVQLFRQAEDLKTRNTQGIAPLQGDIDRIDAVTNSEELYAFLREAALTTNLWGLYGVIPQADLADSSQMVAWYFGPVLGLPNRDYYWVDDANNEAVRKAYKETSAKLLGYLGYDQARATAAAQAVYDFEKALAEPLLAPADYNDPTNFYHPTPVADLTKANPTFDWPAFLDFMGIKDQKTIVVTEVKYLNAVDGIVQKTDLKTVKDYLKLQALWSAAPSLSEEISDTAFAFTGTTLTGVTAQKSLDEQALNAVNASLGFALGKLYVEKYFPPEAKAQIEKLVDREVDATRRRIEALSWMSPETKKTAEGKLDKLRKKVGYPDKWQTYENVSIEKSYNQTLLSANIAEYKRVLAQVGKPVDRDEWGILPQTVNAYYNPSNNEIVFPAAILQPPFFDYRADLASNFGGIGAVIGHEITHGFDQSGSQYDAEGNLVDWWTPEDKSHFQDLTAKVVAQYDAIEVLPGLNVDGNLTIGENIADMGGTQIAYDALQAALKEVGDPGSIDGFTQDQRFFLAWAGVWADKSRDEYTTTLVKSDEHAPAKVRGAQPQRNMQAFFDAFGIKPGDPVYLAPEERVVIW
jgi:predicted metalloendopeptidase